MSLWEMCTQTKNVPVTKGPTVVDRERQARTTAYSSCVGRRGTKRCLLLKGRVTVFSPEQIGPDLSPPGICYFNHSFLLNLPSLRDLVLMKNRCALGAKFSSCLTATEGKGNKESVTKAYLYLAFPLVDFYEYC